MDIVLNVWWALFACVLVLLTLGLRAIWKVHRQQLQLDADWHELVRENRLRREKRANEIERQQEHASMRARRAVNRKRVWKRYRGRRGC